MAEHNTPEPRSEHEASRPRPTPAEYLLVALLIAAVVIAALAIFDVPLARELITVVGGTP